MAETGAKRNERSWPEAEGLLWVVMMSKRTLIGCSRMAKFDPKLPFASVIGFPGADTGASWDQHCGSAADLP